MTTTTDTMRDGQPVSGALGARRPQARIGDRVECRDGRCGRLTDRDGAAWIVRVDGGTERPIGRDDFRIIGVEGPLPTRRPPRPGAGRPPALTPEQVAEVAHRYREGEPVKALVLAYGCSDRTIREALIAAGVYVGRDAPADERQALQRARWRASQAAHRRHTP